MRRSLPAVPAALLGALLTACTSSSTMPGSTTESDAANSGKRVGATPPADRLIQARVTFRQSWRRRRRCPSVMTTGPTMRRVRWPG